MSTATETPCPPHYWRINAPNGKTSVGYCKKCGLKRRFHNTKFVNFRTGIDQARSYYNSAKKARKPVGMHIEDGF